METDNGEYESELDQNPYLFPLFSSDAILDLIMDRMILNAVIRQSEEEYKPPENPATTEEIDKLEKETVANIQCGICMENTNGNETVLILPCEHKFHEECLKPWLRINKFCPICRADVTKNEDNKQES